LWRFHREDGGYPVVQANDLGRSIAAFDAISTLVLVLEMSKASWLMTSINPDVTSAPGLASDER
jgi:hypothetical protein